MASNRAFAYNPLHVSVTGTINVGDLCVGHPTVPYATTGLQWWGGPDEDLGWVIAVPVPSDTQPTPDPNDPTAQVGFWGTEVYPNPFDDSTFINLANQVSNGATGPFPSSADAISWINANGYWTNYTGIGLRLHLDAGNPTSYSGTGTTWYDLSGNGNDVTMQNIGFITYYGGTGYFSTGNGGWFRNGAGSNLPIGNSQYTYVAWVQFPGGWNSNGIMSIGGFGTNNQSNALRTGSTNQFLNYWWGNDLSASSSISPATNWVNIVAKFNGTTRSIWVNGTLVGSDTPNSHNVISSVLQIGKTAGTEYLKGNIAVAKIYDSALSDEQITQYFNDTKSRFGY